MTFKAKLEDFEFRNKKKRKPGKDTSEYDPDKGVSKKKDFLN